jgi:hypothetical protein
MWFRLAWQAKISSKGTENAAVGLCTKHEPTTNANEEVSMRVDYYVIFQDGGWIIERQGQRYGPYPSSQAALSEAIYVADYSIRHGLEAQVIVEEKEPEKSSLYDQP